MHHERHGGNGEQRSALRRTGVGMLCTVLGILICCVADGVLTQILISRGAYEANPVMGWALSRGASVFMWVKYSMTGLAMLFLVMVHDRELFGGALMVRDVLPLIELLYVLLLVHEAFLMAWCTGPLHA